MLAFELPPVRLGTLADWLAAAGTVGAFWVTYLLLRKEQRARREQEEDRRQAQARLVSAWTTFPRPIAPHSSNHVLDIVVKNMSEEPVYDMRVTIVPRDSPFAEDPEEATGPHVIRMNFGMMPPEERGATTVSHVPDKSMAMVLAFTDAQGRRWRRMPSGLLEGPPRLPAGPDRIQLWSMRQLDGLDRGE